MDQYAMKDVAPLLHLDFKQPVHNGKSLAAGNGDLQTLGKVEIRSASALMTRLSSSDIFYSCP